MEPKIMGKSRSTSARFVERRASARLKLSFPVEIAFRETEDWIVTEGVEIGAGGLRILYPSEIAPTTSMKVRFILPTPSGNTSFQFCATVLRCQRLLTSTNTLFEIAAKFDISSIEEALRLEQTLIYQLTTTR
ncbi:PilZ domain-containing protein [Chthonomonas calidirosea]|uniref:PilZ domain-containing protein n=1 Tax=Chthonomonas calidirosea TaxID=454171 RepID=UPI0006ECA053|nr:PilZ domain-containing protein [Chthonomonas calidirosea]CEK17750.1 PilZ domain-containing protein [Chthonomonas calidirosea]